MIKRLTVLIGGMMLLTACGPEEEFVRPQWVELTREAAGHYCQMIVLDHPGPKAQVHIAGLPQPVWFAQVRDAIAFTRMPEEPKDIAAIYVSDMGKAESWDKPGATNWIAIEDAMFVIGSKGRGGMGAPETIPFATKAAAETYRASHGGTIVSYSDVPDDAVFGTVNVGEANETAPDATHSSNHSDG